MPSIAIMKETVHKVEAVQTEKEAEKKEVDKMED